MKRIWIAALLYVTAVTPACAAFTSLYAGLQVNDTSASASLGYHINKDFAVEAHYRKSDEHISHSGITSDTSLTAAGLSVLGMIPMKLSGGSAYFLFVKAGYERTFKDESYSIPSSVTLTLPYQDNVSSSENHATFGGGVQYDFYQNLSGRAGIDILGDKRSVYLGAILKF